MEEVGEERKSQYKKGLWKEEEDKILMEHIKVHGKGKWNHISKMTGLKRCGKSCRLRWINYLSPNVKRGDFSQEEEDLIIRLHKLLGNRWSLIAGRIPGRTDNQVKNHWNAHLSKKLGVKKAKKQPCSLSVLPSSKESVIAKEITEHRPQSSISSNVPVHGDNGGTIFGLTVNDGPNWAWFGTPNPTQEQEMMRECLKGSSSFSFSNEYLDPIGNSRNSMELLNEYYPLDLLWHGL